MEDRKIQIKGRAKGLIALVLTFMLLFGNSLTVFAMSYSVNNNGLSTTFKKGKKISSSDSITWTGTGNLEIYVDNSSKKICTNTPGTGADVWNVDAEYWVVSTRNKGTNGGELMLSTTEVLPDEETEEEEEQSGGDEKHTHNFQWQTVKEPTETEDGLAKNICSCGMVDGEQTISSATGYINEIRDSIEGAPEGGTVEINTEIYRCYTSKIMKALAKRGDVTLKTTYLAEDGTWKSFTIPAGSAPTDGEQFYGFTYLGNRYGWN